MELRDLRVSINEILDEMEKRPEDQLQLKDELRSTISIYGGARPVAANSEPAKPAYPDQEDDFFDNMPV